MMPSSAIDARPDTRSSCRLSAGSDQARITTSDSPALPPPIPSRPRPDRSFTPTYPTTLGRKPIAATLTIQPQQARTRGKIPITPAAPPPHTYVPRFRALALFGRRPQERVEGFVMPASKDLHNI